MKKKNQTSTEPKFKRRELTDTITAYDGVNRKGKRITTVKVTGTESLAQKQMAKRLGIKEASIVISTANSGMECKDPLQVALSLDILEMNDTYSGNVVCHDELGDTYDEVKGSDLAQEKAFKNMREAAASRFKRWQERMIQKIYTVNPETFDEALEKALVGIEKTKSDIEKTKKASKKSSKKSKTTKTTKKTASKTVKPSEKETVKSSEIKTDIKSLDEAVKETTKKRTTRTKATSTKKTTSKK